MHCSIILLYCALSLSLHLPHHHPNQFEWNYDNHNIIAFNYNVKRYRLKQSISEKKPNKTNKIVYGRKWIKCYVLISHTNKPHNSCHSCDMWTLSVLYVQTFLLQCNNKFMRSSAAHTAYSRKHNHHIYWEKLKL